MVSTHNLGFPRIGTNRELKFALESYWQKDIDAGQLKTVGAQIRAENWQRQSELDWLPVGDFSLYDQVLDTSFLLGHIPARVRDLGGVPEDQQIDNYFRLARGRSANDSECSCIRASEMTKWFDTNYHYIVPEFDAQTKFSLNAEQLLDQIKEAEKQGYKTKPVILGPLSYLALGKTKNNFDVLALFPQLIDCYSQLINTLAEHGCEWVQIDEPVLATNLDENWLHSFHLAYHKLKASPIKILLATYFGELQDNLLLACELPVAGLHLDAIKARQEVNKLVDWLPAHKILSLGVIDGRNIWKTDLNNTLDWLEPVHERLQDRLWIAPSCSLLHVPVDLSNENQLPDDVVNWLAFAQQKISELSTLASALNHGRAEVINELNENRVAIEQRRNSDKVHKPRVQQRLLQIKPNMTQRQSKFSIRSALQERLLKLPVYPTTSIGSFPQTQGIRQARRDYKSGVLEHDDYQSFLKREIKLCIEQQEALDIDVLVHGEAERNDMVEYFGEQLSGYAFSQSGWVQSYGSRCVKPPILYGDVERTSAMTVEWAQYAQSLSKKPVKGMLTGPVTILNWSFVRDDQPREFSCKQIALAIRDEVLELEAAGISIIQIDEAALREGLPLRQSDWGNYLRWSVESFKLCANGVADGTQIHTHMCYSEFNDIITAIADMDADVITIETSRSDMELLDVFENYEYPNDIGPGVYDIHSPNIPSVSSIVQLIEKAQQRIPKQRLWINPDCGLKTRQWPEVEAALKNMVTAAQQLRATI